MKSRHYTLPETLELAGIQQSGQVKVLAESEASSEGNARVHAETNRHIARLVGKNKLGACIHVTGDARALTDPFHRRLCEEISRSEARPFITFYKVPAEHAASPDALVAWNLKRWSKGRAMPWREAIRTIGSIADGSVDLFSYEDRDSIQFSVFGDKYIQLQEPHNESARGKRVWLIESEALNAQFTERARGLFSVSSNIDEGFYRRFSNSITGLVSRRILILLRTPMPAATILNDKFILDNSEDPSTSLNSMRTMGFVKESPDGLVQLSLSGADFAAAQGLN